MMLAFGAAGETWDRYDTLVGVIFTHEQKSRLYGPCLIDL